MSQIEVICLTYGEPETPKWIQQFQYSLTILKRLTRLVAPIPKIILPFIAAKRAFKRCADQRKTGYGSPLEKISKLFGEDLEKALKSQNPKWTLHVRVAHEFRQPQFLDLIKEISQNRDLKILVIPLYIADSTFTSGISKDDFERFNQENPERDLDISWLPCPNGNTDFAALVVRHILNECERKGISEQELETYDLILGAHGTLVEPPSGVKNGLLETLAHRDQLIARLSSVFSSIQIGFLNHTRGGQWTEPELSQVVADLKTDNARKVLYYPAGFLADNTETEVEGPQLLEGLSHVTVLPCLNNNPTLVNFYVQEIGQKLCSKEKRSNHE